MMTKLNIASRQRRSERGGPVVPPFYSPQLAPLSELATFGGFHGFAISMGGVRSSFRISSHYFFVGIPLITLEMGLGQVFQGGHVVSFNKLNPRLRGVGFAAPWNAYMVVVYYSVVLSWCLVYLYNSFKPHLPWVPSDEMQAECNAIVHEEGNDFAASKQLCEGSHEYCTWDKEAFAWHPRLQLQVTSSTQLSIRHPTQIPLCL